MGIRPCRRGPGCESALRSQVLRGTVILRIRPGQQFLCLNDEGYKPEKCCFQGRKAKGRVLAHRDGGGVRLADSLSGIRVMSLIQSKAELHQSCLAGLSCVRC